MPRYESKLSGWALVKRLHELGFYTDGAGTPSSTAAFVRGQREEWATIVREIGLTAE
jgi:hypothetical protein